MPYQFLVSDYKQKYLCSPGWPRITLNPWSSCLCPSHPGITGQSLGSWLPLIYIYTYTCIYHTYIYMYGVYVYIFTSFSPKLFPFLFVCFCSVCLFVFVLVIAGIKPRTSHKLDKLWLKFLIWACMTNMLSIFPGAPWPCVSSALAYLLRYSALELGGSLAIKNVCQTGLGTWVWCLELTLKVVPWDCGGDPEGKGTWLKPDFMVQSLNRTHKVEGGN